MASAVGYSPTKHFGVRIVRLIQSVFIALNYDMYAGVCQHIDQIKCLVCVVITSKTLQFQLAILEGKS
uniref:Uncharacterized protein n=1 Tax=Hyaloperonospora arabidopsidis (strain Emoy2) TaxID=559515 RepID=M4B8C6_HYAAE